MVTQKQEIDSLLNMCQENSERVYPNIDYDCLRKYDENNEHFSMGIILENEGEEQQRLIGYNCIYRYETHRIQLEYSIENNIWRKNSSELNAEENENILESLYDRNYDIRSLFQSFTLNQQIQLIIKRYDKHFFAIDRIEKEQEYEHKPSFSTSISEEMSPGKILENDFVEVSLYKPIELFNVNENKDNDKSENDFVDYGLHSLITGSRPKFSGLAAPPPVAPRRSRQNSAFSQCSVRYASFIPPPTAPIRRRRVIESILLHVQRKKKLFEKLVDVLKGTESTTMYQLGLEFLRVYDGKFNYPKEHTFIMSFRKKTWHLTMKQIKCVDCPAGDIGPRSVLILEYKGRHTSVHV